MNPVIAILLSNVSAKTVISRTGQVHLSEETHAGQAVLELAGDARQGDHIVISKAGEVHSNQETHIEQAVLGHAAQAYVYAGDKSNCSTQVGDWYCGAKTDCCDACAQAGKTNLCTELAALSAAGCEDSKQCGDLSGWACGQGGCDASCTAVKMEGKNWCPGGATSAPAPVTTTSTTTRPPVATNAPTSTAYVAPPTGASGETFCANQAGQYNCQNMAPMDCITDPGMMKQCLFTCKTVCQTWSGIYGADCGVTDIVGCEFPDGTTWEGGEGAPFYPGAVDADNLAHTQPEDNPKTCDIVELSWPSAPYFGGYWEQNTNYKGYEPVMKAERDGNYTISSDGNTVNVSTALPLPPGYTGAQIAPGSYAAADFYRQRGAQKLQSVGWTSAAHGEARQRSASTASCNTVAFGYDDLSESVGMFPDFIGYDNVTQNKLDLASFLANTSVETSGASTASANYWGWSWCFNAEQNTAAAANYGTQDNFMSSPCDNVLAKPSSFDRDNGNYGYFGRGAMQLSWCFNYGPFGKWAADHAKHRSAGIDFLASPSAVVAPEWTWTAGLWFYMSAASSNDKPSMHSIVDFWTPSVTTADQLAYDQTGLKADLGYQINVLNGAMECKAGSALGGKPQRRLEYFFAFLEKLEVDTEDKPYLSVDGGCRARGTTISFKYFYDPSTGSYTAADTKNSVQGC